MEVHIHNTEQEITICENHLRNVCELREHCPLHHSTLPYLWQVYCKGWITVTADECEIIELLFSQPNSEENAVQLMLPSLDGTVLPTDVLISFNVMKLAVNNASSDGRLQKNEFHSIRRLSTPSFSISDSTISHLNSPKYLTQWRWYYAESGQWIPFGEDGFSPGQWTLEEKFLAGQEVFRFELTIPPRSAQTFLIHFPNLEIWNAALKNTACIRRRPLFIKRGGASLKNPYRKENLFKENVPSNWYPLDQSNDYELVPLNPDSMEYHLVASELTESLKDRQICDVFRLQNAFLWHKYHSKKLYLLQKGIEPNEMQLFHGTTPESTVQSIFRQNFDWRLCGRNNTLYGRGTYFAKKASYSDKYTGVAKPLQFRWMFLARVIVGRFIKGKKEYLRPPSVDPSNRLSDLYESCVDVESNPNIYVIFDSDQCYPEYVISYK